MQLMHTSSVRRPFLAAAVLVLGLGLMLGPIAMSGAAGGSGESAKAQQVLRVVMHESADHQFDGHHDAGTDVLRHNGRIVGYENFSEDFNLGPITRYRFALALNRGMIVGRVVRDTRQPVIDGPILFGSGKFASIKGTATLKIVTPTRQILIVRYRL